MSSTRGPIHSRRWTEFRKKVFTTYGTVCWLCGHEGAREVDHVIPRKIAPELFWSLHNLRPAHGSNGKCPVCGKACNQERRRDGTMPTPAIPKQRKPPTGRPW